MHGQNSPKNDISSLLIVKKKRLREEKKQDRGISLLHAESSKSGVHILLFSLITISMSKRCKLTVLVSVCRMLLHMLNEVKEQTVVMCIILKLV